MKKIEQAFLTGERALFHGEDLEIAYTTFADGESPLKESKRIRLSHCMFKWKYPLWYGEEIVLRDCTLFDMARAGIWYTRKLDMADTVIEAPKTFRRSEEIRLRNVSMPNAEETLWSCRDIRMENVQAKGNYFGMNSSGIRIDGFTLCGNYPFDGARDVEICHAKMLSKDAFWNCENVTVRDSFLSGEYLGWNSRNVTFENCVIESLQGMCYMENVVLKNCRLLNTTLAFEYSSVDAGIEGRVDSVFNPESGVIRAGEIGELTMDASRIDPGKTEIVLKNRELS